MIIWQALTCFPAGTEHAAAGFLPNVRSLCAEYYTGDAQTMLDLGVAADLHFANFLLINEQEDLFGENDEDTPAYDNQLVVLQSSKLQFLQLQGPGNGDLLLEVRKVSVYLECCACHVELCGSGPRWSDDMEMAYDLSEPPVELRSRHFS